MKNLLRLLVLTLAVVVPALAQDAQEAKTQAYTKFYEAIQANKLEEAYQIGKDYLSKFGTENDQYTTYVKTTVENYEKGQRLGRIAKVIASASVVEPSKANYNEAFTLGRQVLQSEPDNLNVLITLGYAGYQANTANNTAFNQDAAAFARRAISLVEAGRQPEDLYPDNNDIGPFYPFKDRDEALAYLHFALGEMALKSNPAEAARHYIKAMEFNSQVKTTPVIFTKLAAAYAASEYEPKSKEFETRFPAGSPETEESKAAQAELNSVIDRLMDAHARVIAYSGTKPEFQKYKDTSMQIVTQLYKFRNNDSTEGLQAYLAGITSQPLPQPGVTNAPAATSGTAAPAATATPAATSTQTSSSTPPASAAATTATPARANGTAAPATGRAATTTTNARPAANTTTGSSAAAKPATSATSKPKQTTNGRRP